MQPKRKSLRAKFHNYSNGDYFVTICTSNKEHYFGVINKGEMCLSMIGKYCKIQLDNITNHYPYASVPLYVIMPNHIHAIISIDSELRTHEPCVPTFGHNRQNAYLSIFLGCRKICDNQEIS